MTVTGSGVARSSTMSMRPVGATRAISSRVISRMRGSISATMRGVNARFTRLRSCVWSGGSELMIDRVPSIVPPTAPTPIADDENSAWFLSTKLTSSYRLIAQKFIADGWTGPPSRSCA